VLEASIPFQLLTGKDELRKGDSVRFDFMINDRDGERKEYSRHPLWTRVNTWKNTSEFGRMVLD
jgi:hypothetical protein